MVRNKNIKLMAFDLEFTSNLSLPNFIGVGKNASIGYGIVTEKREQ
ncbi:MAG: CRISPR-associated endonuclease Cas6 [Bacteroidota bacterium]|nr:CRISPR-associated endonuclease Cas6 [Bacteroidota bacterium]